MRSILLVGATEARGDVGRLGQEVGIVKRGSACIICTAARVMRALFQHDWTLDTTAACVRRMFAWLEWTST
eukprot:10051271-Lingulodinium_polyedra.AAC.1